MQIKMHQAKSRGDLRSRATYSKAWSETCSATERDQLHRNSSTEGTYQGPDIHQQIPWNWHWRNTGGQWSRWKSAYTGDI